MRRRHRRSDCPVHFALEVFGDPWTLLIVRDLMFKDRTTYTEFLRAEEGIATNVLADRLVRLEQNGIVEKDPASGGGYRLTAKGIDLLPILLEIIAWSAKHDERTAADRAFVRRFRSDKEAFARKLRGELEVRHTRPGSAGRRAKLLEVPS
ncbi:MAG TPA: helix-turn-helix domain-containing protein [Polyangia bacterium]|jgi:DNA-binding HxlR family transcriptional regulator|nr:helix-turn-helix domain-containing protein [Polyangia bacterium]